MNKFIFRTVFLITFIIILLFNFKPIESRVFLNNTLVGRIIATVFVFGIIYLYGFMFYHWGTHTFTKKAYKVIWFWVMIIGLYFGVFAYYIFVYELRKTVLNGRENNKPSK
jgi:hypothetical protein